MTLGIRVKRVAKVSRVCGCEGCGAPGVNMDGSYVDADTAVAELQIGDMYRLRLCARCLAKLELVARNAIQRVLEEGSKR